MLIFFDYVLNMDCLFFSPHTVLGMARVAECEYVGPRSVGNCVRLLRCVRPHSTTHPSGSWVRSAVAIATAGGGSSDGNTSATPLLASGESVCSSLHTTRRVGTHARV